MTTQMAVTAGGPPPTTLAAAPVAAGGTFGAGAYFWKATFVTPGGAESNGSAEATCTVAASGHANLTWDPPPSSAAAVKIYRGTVTNTENALIATLPGNATAYTDTGTVGTAATPPAVAFASVTLTTGTGTVAKSSTGLSGLVPGRLINCLQALNTWRNCAGLGTAAAQAQALANAQGMTLQEI